MTLLIWTLLLLGLGLLFLVAEVMLFAHGAMALTGAVLLSGSVALFFMMDFWAGIAAMVTLVVSTPLGWIWVVTRGPRTRIGRQLVLASPEAAPVELLPVQIGQVGASSSELRPMGICEFNGRRVEAVSELGIIPPGAAVKVVAINARKPVVRAIASNSGSASAS